MTPFINVILALLVGIIIGWRLTWAYMEHQWKTNPYQFKALVDGVIKLREEQAAKK